MESVFSIELFKLAGFYLCRLRTFTALSCFVLNFLAFIERAITFGHYIGMMNKHIGAAVIGNDKTKTLALIEPFYCASTHYFAP